MFSVVDLCEDTQLPDATVFKRLRRQLAVSREGIAVLVQANADQPIRRAVDHDACFLFAVLLCETGAKAEKALAPGPVVQMNRLTRLWYVLQQPSGRRLKKPKGASLTQAVFQI